MERSWENTGDMKGVPGKEGWRGGRWEGRAEEVADGGITNI